MRESRTYGSVRGARDETRVPTATPFAMRHLTLANIRCGWTGSFRSRTVEPKPGIHKLTSPATDLLALSPRQMGLDPLPKVAQLFCRSLSMPKPAKESPKIRPSARR